MTATNPRKLQTRTLADGVTVRYRAQIWDPGARRTITSKWGSQEQAEAWLAEKAEEFDSAREAAVPKPPEVVSPRRFGSTIGKMEEDARLGRFATQTGELYNLTLVREACGRLRNHASALHDHDLHDVTPAMVNTLLDEKRASLSERGVHDLTRALRLYYRWAILSGYAKSDPTEGLPTTPIKTEAPEDEPPTAQELDRAMNATYSDPFVHAMFCLAGDAGLSLGEILALTRPRVHLEADVVNIEEVWDAKALRRTPAPGVFGKREQTLGPTAKEALERWIDLTDPRGTLFPTFGPGGNPDRAPDPTRPVSYKTFLRLAAQCFDKAGAPPMTLSEARRAFGRRLVEERGVDLAGVARTMGYTDMRRVQRNYGRYVPKLDDRTLADRLLDDARAALTEPLDAFVSTLGVTLDVADLFAILGISTDPRPAPGELERPTEEQVRALLRGQPAGGSGLRQDRGRRNRRRPTPPHLDPLPRRARRDNRRTA